MRKRGMIFLFIVWLTVLSSCQTATSEEEQILSQYQSFLEEDIIDDTYFDVLINEITNQTIPGFLRINHSIHNVDGILLDEKIGSGVIYKALDQMVYVVTPSSLINNDIPESISTLKVYDYLNRPYTATAIDISTTYDLAILQFSVNVEVANLHSMTISNYSPLIHEPVMMISYYHQIHNSMLMGFVDQKPTDYESMLITIPGDTFIIGAAILNMRNEFVGIVMDYIDGQAVILDVQYFHDYLQ